MTLGLYLAILAIIFAAPYLLARIPDLQQFRVDRPVLMLLISSSLLAFTVSNIASDQANEHALHFSQSEVDFLFSAPFSRTELLIYKLITSRFVGVFTSALAISIWLIPLVSWWYPVFVGLFLALVFANLLPLALALVRERLAAAAYTRMRKAALLAIMALLAFAVLDAVMMSPGYSAMQKIIHLRETAPGRLLYSVFDCFSRVILAANLVDMLLWISIATALNAALFFVIIRLDADYLEAAVHQSQRISQNLARSKVMAPTNVSSRAPRSVSSLPFLKGGFANSTRQLISGLRRNRLRTWGLLALTMACGLVVLHQSKHLFSTLSVYLLVALTSIASACVTLFPFDFRRDLDRLHWLKAMPVKSSAIVLGQLLAPACVTLGICVSYLIVLSVTAYGLRKEIFLAALLLPPYSLFVFGYANFAFLLYPVRPKGGISVGAGVEVVAFVKSLVFVVLLALAALVALIVSFILGGSVAAYWTTFGLLITFLALSVVPAVAWAFDRFDVSMDIPPNEE